MPYARAIKQILWLQVEATYLARVYEATWLNADMEMKNYIAEHVAHTYSFMSGNFMGSNLCIVGQMSLLSW